MRNVLVSKLFALFFLLIFLALQLGKVIIVADYYTNTNKYAKNCINKSRPKLHCNGKCQMFKKIKKQEGDNGANATAPKFNQPDIVLSSKSFFPTIERAILQNKNRYFTYNSTVPTNHLRSIFQPPGA